MNELLHVGIIPDGNRRWARSRGLTIRDAYEAGYSKLKEVARYLFDYNVRYLTVYAMSYDNCVKRDVDERNALLRVLDKAIVDLERERLLDEYDVKLVVSGDLTLIPDGTRRKIQDLVERYSSGRRVLHVGLCYSVWWELSQLKHRNLGFEQRMPPIDLVIRTGGARRISGFFPLLVEYAELYFTDTLWPELTRRELDLAIEWFKRQRRNFGR
jgi:tritrans,polycis-undecaprenyl-diphosphate synthase [geranylgeranyl-diphosphate specific]